MGASRADVRRRAQRPQHRRSAPVCHWSRRPNVSPSLYAPYNALVADGALHRLLAGLTPPAGLIDAAGTPAELAEAAELLGQGPTDWAVAMSRRSFELVLAAMPGGRPPTFAAELLRAIETSALDLLRTLYGDSAPPRPPSPSRLTADQVTLVHQLVRLRVPFERIVRGLRIVQQHWTEVLVGAIERHRPARERTPLLREIMRVVPAFFDDSVDGVVAEYLAERQRLMARSLSSRRDMVLSIIAGGHPAEEAARRTLGIGLAQHHLAFVVWSQDDLDSSPDRHGELERAALRGADALRCPAPLTVPGDDGEVWSWASQPQPFPEDYLGPLSVFAGGRVRIAVGVPGHGPAGFRRSHLAAQDAYRVARSAVPARPVTGYRDVSLVALLSADAERAGWFVAEELGALAAADPGTAELRATLLCYLDVGRSFVAAAAALHVHRNTVVYRLRRVERLTGRPISDCTVETHAALTLAGRLGPAVLVPLRS
ncbi:MAG: hypothetical protein GEV03_07075 [Streptosporangiales bacterium]|nr:hypothetical protein [Streptosporangiales bacterium]